MKLVSRHDERRPQDRIDLLALAAVADRDEWTRAEQAVQLIERRGFAQKRDLQTALAELRDRATGVPG